MARPGADGGARHYRRRCRRGDPRQQFQSAPGQAKGFYTLTNVDAKTGLTDVAQFKQMVVKTVNGAVVRMEDIANVDLGAQSWNSSVMMNGQHAVFIGIQVTPDGNPLSLVKGVLAVHHYARIPALRAEVNIASLPCGRPRR